MTSFVFVMGETASRKAQRPDKAALGRVLGAPQIQFLCRVGSSVLDGGRKFRCGDLRAVAYRYKLDMLSPTVLDTLSSVFPAN